MSKSLDELLDDLAGQVVESSQDLLWSHLEGVVDLLDIVPAGTREARRAEMIQTALSGLFKNQPKEGRSRVTSRRQGGRSRVTSRRQAEQLLAVIEHSLATQRWTSYEYLKHDRAQEIYDVLTTLVRELVAMDYDTEEGR